MSATLFGCQFQQPALPTFGALVYPKPSRYSLGWMGEVTVQQRLSHLGYHVTPARRAEGDLRVIDPATGQILRIEVKTALRSIDHKWRFTLIKSGCTDYRHSNLVVLLAVLDDYTYIPFSIPVAVLSDRSQLCITSHPATYKGWLAPYRLPDLLSFTFPSPCNGEGPGVG